MSNTVNPLLEDHAIPPFDRILNEHYKPAITQELAAIETRLAEIKAKPASFENTVVPLEKLFSKVSDIMMLLGNANLNTYSKERSEIEGDIDVTVSDFSKKVYQDRELGRLFQDVYRQRDSLPLDGDDRTVLRDIYWEFESCGAFLSADDQDRIRAIDADLLKAAQTFRDNMQAAPSQQSILITDRAELAGLSEDEIAGLQAQSMDHARRLTMTPDELKAKGLGPTYISGDIADVLKAALVSGDFSNCYLFVPERLLVDEWLEKAENSDFRRKICVALEGIGTQAPFDNEPVIADLHKLRQEYATLLGYPNYASFARTRTMKTLAEAQDLLQKVADAALPKFEEEVRALETFSADHGGPAKLEPWDVPYWATRQAQALYNFDANAFSSYLPIKNVMDGLLEEAALVGGLEYRESTGKYPMLHPDMQTYDVINPQTGRKSILCVDLYARPGTKVGGAWMNTIQAADGDRPAIIIFNMNFSQPAAGKQALIALSQLETTYHEDGHARHGLEAVNSKYRSLNNVYGPGDFFELQSMINESRGVLRENMKKHARHIVTGLPPDDAMLDTMEAASGHFRSRELLKIVQNSFRDLAFHSTAPENYQGTKALEKSVAFDSPYMDHIRAYSCTRFTHPFDSARGSYCAGYVNYLIAQEHAEDGAAFMNEGPYDPQRLKKLRDLYNPAAGRFGDFAGRYRDFRGRDATPAAMLRKAGIGPA
jgi:peptidyl-dipeptidase Dcp